MAAVIKSSGKVTAKWGAFVQADFVTNEAAKRHTKPVVEDGTMNAEHGNEIACYERPESQGRGNLGQSRGVKRRARSASWPDAVSTGARGVFSSTRTLKRLRSLGLDVDQVRIEILSRHGFGFWVMARGFGNPVVHGRTLTEATLGLVELLAPEVAAS